MILSCVHRCITTNGRTVKEVLSSLLERSAIIACSRFTRGLSQNFARENITLPLICSNICQRSATTVCQNIMQFDKGTTVYPIS